MNINCSHIVEMHTPYTLQKAPIHTLRSSNQDVPPSLLGYPRCIQTLMSSTSEMVVFVQKAL